MLWLPQLGRHSFSSCFPWHRKLMVYEHMHLRASEGMDLGRAGFRGELKEQKREGGSLPSARGWVCAVGKGGQGLGVGRMVIP